MYYSISPYFPGRAIFGKPGVGTGFPSGPSWTRMQESKHKISREGPFFSGDLSGLRNANAKSQCFSYPISQIAPLPPVVAPNRPVVALNRPVVALNRNFKSQIATRYAAFWYAVPQIALTSFLQGP